MRDKDFFTGSHNPLDIGRAAAFDLAFRRDNPTYFDPDGIWVFCGAQGSGKTLSAVQTVKAVLREYPKAIFCSNLVVHGIDREIIPFTDYSQIEQLDNGIEGVVFLIDEIQVVWNCIESKNIPITELGCLCMNRKARRLVIGTSQVYGRVAKPIREQYKYVVLCNNILKYIQFNTVVDPCAGGYSGEDDGHFEGEIVKKSLFFHSPEAYKSYDTFDKIARIDRKKKLKEASYL